jgi:hypothetical protein
LIIYPNSGYGRLKLQPEPITFTVHRGDKTKVYENRLYPYKESKW